MIGTALMFPMFAEAFSKPTFAFGGKVLTTTLPSVICTTIGTAPVVLSSNLGGVMEIAAGGVGVVSGAYNILPYYAPSPLKRPVPGSWVLGNAEIVPNFHICNSTLLGGFPVPVKKMTEYGVSARPF